MAKIPGYQSQGNITTASPAAKRDPREAGMIGENIQEVGKIISRTGQQVGDIVEYRKKVAAERQRLQDETESMRAEIDLTEKMNNIRIEADKDPDIYNAPKNAREKYTKALEEASKGITSEQAREKFKLKADLDNQRHFFSIEEMADRKRTDARRATLLDRNDQLAKEYHKENDPAIKEQLISDIILNAKKSMAQGDMSRVAGKKYIEDMRKSIAIGQVDYDLGKAYTSDNFESEINNIITRLKATDEKGYQNLTMAERGKMIAKAQRALRVAQSNKENANIAEQTNILKNWDSVTQDDILSAWHSGKIGADFARKVISAKNNPKEITQNLSEEKDTTYKGYQLLIQKSLAQDANPKDIQIKIAEAYAKGEIKDKDVSEIAALLELDNKTPVRSGFQMLGDWLKHLPMFERKKAEEELAQEVKNGLPPEQAPAKAKEIADKVVKENNPNRTKYEVGKVYPSEIPGGRSFKVIGYYDDGEPDVEFIDK